LSLDLSQEEMDEIEGAAEFEIGFPLSMLAGNSKGPKGPDDVWLAKATGRFDFVEEPKPIKAHKN